jgi:dienelactone hydrolase
MKLPVVVALHGTGGKKEDELPLLDRLGGLGFLAVAIDGRHHGARTRAGQGSSEYVAAILRAYRGSGEHPFLYDTVWDLMRLVDWLSEQPDVDAGRIGMIGFSKGGMELYLAAAADPRIAAAVPCIGVQSFRWALENNAWQSRVGTFQSAVDTAARDAGVDRLDGAFLKRFYDRVAPGVYGEFDGPQMLPLIASRPLLVINGDSDARTPMPGLRECLDAAERAYRDAAASDRYRVLIEPKTGHKVNPEALDTAFRWFSQWLG